MGSDQAINSGNKMALYLTWGDGMEEDDPLWLGVVLMGPIFLLGCARLICALLH